MSSTLKHELQTCRCLRRTINERGAVREEQCMYGYQERAEFNPLSLQVA